jgi:hypothetical protein
MRIWPRRIVWQRTWPSTPVTYVWHDSRNFPFKCCSASVIGDSSSLPLHHLHHALFAFALLPARGGHIDPQSLRLIEKRKPALSLDRLPRPIVR